MLFVRALARYQAMVAQTRPEHPVAGVANGAPPLPGERPTVTVMQRRLAVSSPVLRLGGGPSAPTKLSGELLRGKAAHHLFVGRRSGDRLRHRRVPLGFCFQELVDEGRRFVASEPPSSLALGEPHGAPSITEVRMAGIVEQGEQFPYLPGRGGWS